MLNPKHIETILQEAFHDLPEGLKALPNELKMQLKSSLKQTLSAMDLVTREEFDAQVGVLKRTREKLIALEKSMEALQQQR